MAMAQAKDEFPLADLISRLGDELREAQAQAATDQKEDQFKLKEATVELAWTFNKKADGGIDFKVVKLGGELSKENAQTLTVTLEPLTERERKTDPKSGPRRYGRPAP
jgi:hypothetical protein